MLIPGLVCLVVVCAAIYFYVTGAAARRRGEFPNHGAADQADASPLPISARLKDVSQKYDALMAYCGAGVLILNADNVIESANTTARYLFGVPSSSMIGRSLVQVTLSNEFTELVRTARETRCLQRREIQSSSSNGITLIVTASPVSSEEPERSRIAVIAHDVTELRRLENVRRDFVANVSHELRTPLASIRAMAETLQDGALQDPAVAQHFLETIINEAQRLTRISEDLLTLSRAESRSPEKSEMNLSELIARVAHRMEAQAQKGGIRLCEETPPELRIFANYDQIEQVLVNLLDNAIKYTPNGGQVGIIAKQEGETITVQVKDTGIGIMDQDLPRLFERFYRVDKARSRQSGGTGLGLAIVKHIVEAHGGNVRVESEYNHGSVFTVTLPVRVEEMIPA